MKTVRVVAGGGGGIYLEEGAGIRSRFAMR